ncbi:MAG: hypothetical protein KAR30_00355 [Gammaproteobacteria bacterium]|nr:hypothetical protein [Gammaproteobacteria bacterium]
MNRRLYFLLPDVSHTLRVINELLDSDIDMRVHIKVGAGIDRSSLPEALQDIHRDSEHITEDILWNINLFNFFMALLVLVVALLMGWEIITMIMLAIMATTFIVGLIDTTLPDVKLSDFDHALSHREILLMVDTTRNQVTAVEEMVHWHHPEVVDGGVSWHMGKI